ncbi:glycosyltransferase [Culicoidibacter larvae]|nr:glycosyltransferase [Culicoidibacter larvae]
MKKILFVINNLSKNDEATALLALTKRWSDVASITIAHFGVDIEYEFDESIEIISLLDKDLQQPLVMVTNYFNLRRTSFWQDMYNQKLAVANFDLVVAYGTILPFLLIGLGAPKKLAKLAWFHNDPTATRFGLFYNKRQFIKALSQFNNSIAIASHISRKVNKLYGITSEVINNYFECPQKNDEMIERSAKYEFLFIGNLEEHSGIREALEWIRPINADNHLHIIGEGSLRKELQKQAKSMAVTFWGEQQNLAAFYQSVNALIIPAITAGMPVIALEAKCYRLPILVRNQEYLEDLPQDEIYQVDSAIKLAQTITKMNPAPAFEWDNRKIDEQLAKYFNQN